MEIQMIERQSKSRENAEDSRRKINKIINPEKLLPLKKQRQ